MTARLSCHSLCVGPLPGLPLLRTEGFALEGGELVALLGRNGVGKTTLLRTLSGHIPPLEGQILLDGVPLGRPTIRERARRIAFIQTRRGEVPRLTVEEVLQLARFHAVGWFGRYGRRDGELIDRALTLTGLGGMRSRFVETLSDGESQRVWIAAALAQDTPLLLLDEPTAFLDVPAKLEVFALLRSLARSEGKLVILSTHDLDATLHISDRLLLAEEGRLMVATPERAAYEGLISRAFDTDACAFHSDLFAFRPRMHGASLPPVRVVEDGAPAALLPCVCHTLQRLGFPVARQEGASSFTLTLGGDGGMRLSSTKKPDNQRLIPHLDSLSEELRRVADSL